jgi:hypothetical protein
LELALRDDGAKSKITNQKSQKNHKSQFRNHKNDRASERTRHPLRFEILDFGFFSDLRFQICDLSFS